MVAAEERRCPICWKSIDIGVGLRRDGDDGILPQVTVVAWGVQILWGLAHRVKCTSVLDLSGWVAKSDGVGYCGPTAGRLYASSSRMPLGAGGNPGKVSLNVVLSQDTSER
jgi:hypothetical protein